MESPKFILCLKNDDCEDLEVRKIYQTLPNESGEKDGFVRLIDESGDDYLYPQKLFVAVELPQAAQDVLLQAA